MYFILYCMWNIYIYCGYFSLKSKISKRIPPQPKAVGNKFKEITLFAMATIKTATSGGRWATLNYFTSPLDYHHWRRTYVINNSLFPTITNSTLRLARHAMGCFLYKHTAFKNCIIYTTTSVVVAGKSLKLWCFICSFSDVSWE